MKLRELLQWFSNLLLQQKMQDLGDGNIQAGRIEGDLNNNQSHTNQTIYNIVVVSPESTPAEMREPTTSSPPKLAAAISVKKAPEATQSQRDLLRLMAQSSVNEARAEIFMRREFATDRVKKLTSFECLRTIRYLEACVQRDLANSSTAVGMH